MEHKLVTVLCFMLLISSISANVAQEYARRALRTLTGFTTLDNGRSPKIFGPRSPMRGGQGPNRRGPPSRGGEAQKRYGPPSPMHGGEAPKRHGPPSPKRHV
ncbi:hypothetical protein Hanom_Chr01g00083271 [Helianthus anomalus]